MNRFSRMLICGVAAMLVVPCLAAEDGAKKKGKGKGAKPSAAMVGKLSSVELTAEQKAKIDELASELDATMATLKEEGLTAELTKKKAEAMKAAREEGKKGKNIEADVLASMGLTEAETALLKKQGEAQTKFTKGIAALLTDEQIATLPQAVQGQLNHAKPKGKKADAA